MAKFIDLTGRTFAYLTVVQYKGRKNNNSMWLCRCSCGNETVVCGMNIKTGRTNSCGCYQRKSAKLRSTTHGLYYSKEYGVWNTMIQRCTNKNVKHYPDYGGRGITVCERWRTFENFIADIGMRPGNRWTIERKNNNGNYEPSNCGWATYKVQARNTRRALKVTKDGVTKPLKEWCEIYKVNYHTVRNRLRRGWQINIALKQ